MKTVVYLTPDELNQAVANYVASARGAAIISVRADVHITTQSVGYGMSEHNKPVIVAKATVTELK